MAPVVRCAGHSAAASKASIRSRKTTKYQSSTNQLAQYNQVSIKYLRRLTSSFAPRDARRAVIFAPSQGHLGEGQRCFPGRSAPDPPKTAPRPPQSPPRSPTDGLRCPQEGAEVAQEAPGAGQETSKTAREGPNTGPRGRTRTELSS